jgi:hypothetical protein
VGASNRRGGGGGLGYTPTANRIAVGGAGVLTDYAGLTYVDATKTLKVEGADAQGVINATTGNAILDLQKNGTSAVKLRTGTAGHNVDFAANTTNYLNVSGAGAYIGMNVNGKETLFRATKLELPDAYDIDLGTSTGTKIGQATAKIGLYGVTPVARQVLATGAGATVDNVITALQNLGAVKQS